MTKILTQLNSLAIFLFLLNSCQSIPKSDKLPVFPEDWLGTYQGKIEMYNPKMGKYLDIGLKIVISETDTINRWQWQTYYDEFRGQKVTKDYAVFQTDSMPKGHYKLDENNGILLDRVLMGNTFYECFDIAGQGICSTTRLEGNTLYFEVYSYAKKNGNLLSIPNNQESLDTIVSYPLQYTQKAILKRVK